MDPCGYGIPYLSTIGGTADEDLVVACLHLMDVLLNYRPDNINDNIYYTYVNEMDKNNDFPLIGSKYIYIYIMLIFIFTYIFLYILTYIYIIVFKEY